MDKGIGYARDSLLLCMATGTRAEKIESKQQLHSQCSYLHVGCHSYPHNDHQSFGNMITAQQLQTADKQRELLADTHWMCFKLNETLHAPLPHSYSHPSPTHPCQDSLQSTIHSGHTSRVVKFMILTFDVRSSHCNLVGGCGWAWFGLVTILPKCLFSTPSLPPSLPFSLPSSLL